MCKWSGHDVRVNMECASTVRDVRVITMVMCESKCAIGQVIIICE